MRLNAMRDQSDRTATVSLALRARDHTLGRLTGLRKTVEIAGTSARRGQATCRWKKVSIRFDAAQAGEADRFVAAAPGAEPARTSICVS